MEGKNQCLVFNFHGGGAAHNSDPALITLCSISRKIILPSLHFSPLKDTAVTWERRRPSGFYVLSTLGSLTSASVLVKQRHFLTRKTWDPADVWFRKDVLAVAFYSWVKKKLEMFCHYIYLPSAADTAVHRHTSVLELRSKKKKKEK